MAVAAIGDDVGQFGDALDDMGPGGHSCGVGSVDHGVRGGVCLIGRCAMGRGGFDALAFVGRPPRRGGAILN